MIRFFTLLCFLVPQFLISADTLTSKVIKVTDGDTIHVLQNNRIKEKIRLSGIDAPERKQPHGKKATRYLASMIGNKRVTVEFSKHDRYGRFDISRAWRVS